MNNKYISEKTPFEETISFKKLLEQSKKPFNLSENNNLSSNRLLQYTAFQQEFIMMYGTERIDENVLLQLESLSKERDLLTKIKQMQEGFSVNNIFGVKSENQPALHTAMRDIFEDKLASSPEALEASEFAKKECEKLNKFINTVNNYSHVLHIGIGGSDLGPKALYSALSYIKTPLKKVTFVSNVDPDDIFIKIKDLPLQNTLVVVVSKSGSTIETLVNETIAKQIFEKAGLNPNEHFISITTPNSPLDDTSKYKASFYMRNDVGGRYSATSMVGGVVLSLAFGYEVFEQLLAGAHSMDKNSISNDFRNNLPLLGAMLDIWNRNFLNLSSLAILPYSQALSLFPSHIQQCSMESNGKQIDINGKFITHASCPIIWGESGTNGQHSFYQLIHQGTEIVPCEFIGFKEQAGSSDSIIQNTSSQEKLLANLFAQSIALATGQNNENPNKAFLGNRPNRVLLAKKLTAHSLGALLSYYENKIAFEGFCWGINSFDQEGVQLGKILAHDICNMFSDIRNNTSIDKNSLASSFIEVLTKLN